MSRLVARFALLLLAGLALLSAAGPLDAPFLDARQHVEFDNAWFTTMARNGLRNGDARSQLGVTLNRYDRWGERIGVPGYYTHHPFLMKALFEQYARLAGTGESAPRSFALLISLGIAAAVLLLVERSTGRLGAAAAAVAILVSVPVFASFAATLKFESDGMLAGLLWFLAVERSLRRRGGRSLMLVGGAAAVAVLAHWSGALAVAIGGGLVGARALTERRLRALVAATGAGLAAGGIVLAAAMAWLDRGVAPAWHSLAAGFSTRAGTVGFTASDWLTRQWLYLQANFTLPLLVAVAAVAALAVARRLRGPRPHSPDGGPEGDWLLETAVATTLACGVVWVLVFRQGSFVHVYWQLWLALPISLVAGAAVARAQATGSTAAAAAIVIVAAVVYLQAAGASARESDAAARLGTPDDIEFLVSLRDVRFERLAFFALSRTPLNEWFDGPAFEYYTDRPVEIAGPGWRLRASDRVIVVKQPDHARAAADLAGRLGVRLTDERCGARLCAYAVSPP